MTKGFKKIFRLFLIIFLFNFLIIQPVLALKPNDPDYFLQWYIEKINLPLAWDYIQGSNEVVVAVLDTGVDISHPDLAANIWVNMDERGGDGIDNDKNGYIDDINGYDFVDQDSDPAPDFNLPYEFKAISHGTLVAGIIGAVGDNLRGISGIAWNIKLMPLRVLDNYGTANVPPTLEAIEYAINNGADIINLSFQGEFPYDEFQKILEKAHQAGIVITGAAGNGNNYVCGFDLDKTEFYPVCYDTTDGEELVIGVGSTNQEDKRSDFSNYGKKCIDIMAPGEEIYSTQAYRGVRTDLDSYYSGGWKGTSLSTPIISGTAALIKSINKNFSPQLVYSFITENADPIDSLNPQYRDKLGQGRVNAGRAVRAAFNYNNNHPELVSQSPVVYSSFYLPHGLVFSPAEGHQPEVKIFNSQHKEESKFLAYSDEFLGGVNLAVGDINNDGRLEIITGAGKGGGPHVRVFNQGGNLLSQFFAYDPEFHGGVNLAVGDVDADDQLEIVTAPQSSGGPHVRVFDYQGAVKYQFMAYDPEFHGGVNLTLGDINLDGQMEILTAPAEGGGPHVRVFDYQGTVKYQFMAYDPEFHGGVNLAVGDVDGDYRNEIITGPQSGGGPDIRIFDQYGKLKSQFFAFYEKYLGGVNIAVGDYNFDGWDEIVISQASGDPGVIIFDNQGQEKTKFSVFSQDYTGGVNLGIIE